MDAATCCLLKQERGSPITKLFLTQHDGQHAAAALVEYYITQQLLRHSLLLWLIAEFEIKRCFILKDELLMNVFAGEILHPVLSQVKISTK